MARPIRIEFAGALYHVTSRGGLREDIYLEDADRELFLATLGETCQRCNWRVHAYCLMSNHYHLLIETPDSNLSKGMRQLNGVYTQRFNRKNQRVGHVFQGRYKAIIVQKDRYLLELSRYIVLNPIRVNMVKNIHDWSWSNFKAAIGQVEGEKWLATDWLLAQFGKNTKQAISSYIQFVLEGINKPKPWEDIKHQVYLGDEQFIQQFKELSDNHRKLAEIAKTQRIPLGDSLARYKKRYFKRDEAMVNAYLSGFYSMKEIGDFFHVHNVTVSRAIRKFEAQKNLK